eukprot:759325-Hanusia_phi.AAC.3
MIGEVLLHTLSQGSRQVNLRLTWVLEMGSKTTPRDPAGYTILPSIKYLTLLRTPAGSLPGVITAYRQQSPLHAPAAAREAVNIFQLQPQATEGK